MEINQDSLYPVYKDPLETDVQKRTSFHRYILVDPKSSLFGETSVEALASSPEEIYNFVLTRFNLEKLDNLQKEQLLQIKNAKFVLIKSPKRLLILKPFYSIGDFFRNKRGEFYAEKVIRLANDILKEVELEQSLETARIASGKKFSETNEPLEQFQLYISNKKYRQEAIKEAKESTNAAEKEIIVQVRNLINDRELKEDIKEYNIQNKLEKKGTLPIYIKAYGALIKKVKLLQDNVSISSVLEILREDQTQSQIEEDKLILKLQIAFLENMEDLLFVSHLKKFLPIKKERFVLLTQKIEEILSLIKKINSYPPDVVKFINDNSDLLNQVKGHKRVKFKI